MVRIREYRNNQMANFVIMDSGQTRGFTVITLKDDDGVLFLLFFLFVIKFTVFQKHVRYIIIKW